MDKAKCEIYKKEIIRYMCVWVLFFIAIAFALWVSIPAIHIPCNFSEAGCKAINSVILTLSLSYIAGFIFFFLSEFIPTAKRKYEEEHRVVAVLNHLTKEFNGLFNFSSDKDNYQRMPFAELSQSLFQEDVSKYSQSIDLTDKDGECDVDVHFKPQVLLCLELNANRIREDLNVLQLLSHCLSFPVICTIGSIKSSRILSVIDSKSAYRASFDKNDIRIRLALYKDMMKDYYELEDMLMKVTNDYNKRYPEFQMWQVLSSNPQSNTNK